MKKYLNFIPLAAFASGIATTALMFTSGDTPALKFTATLFIAFLLCTPFANVYTDSKESV